MKSENCSIFGSQNGSACISKGTGTDPEIPREKSTLLLKGVYDYV